MKKIISVFLIILPVLSIAINNRTDQKNNIKDSAKAENVSENYQYLLGSVNWYAHSAEMRACYYQTYNLAKWQLEKHLKEVTKNKKKAIVFDIDETLIDNSPFEIKAIESGKGYSKETWIQWTSLARAAAVPGALDFINFAKEKGVEIFYITNRKTEEKTTTIKNLDSLKFPYLDDAHLFFRTDESSKEKRRITIEKEYEILLFVGDNLADFSMIFENRTNNLGFNVVDQNKDKFGDKFIILPNPMYGDWEMAIYGNKVVPTDSEKAKLLKKGLKSGY